eukprot:3592453-Rhodomonas_salina.3
MDSDGTSADKPVLDGCSKGGMTVSHSMSHERPAAVVRHGWAPDSPGIGSLPPVDDNRVDGEPPARGRPELLDGTQHRAGLAVILLSNGGGAAGPLTTASLRAPLLVNRAHCCGKR